MHFSIPNFRQPPTPEPPPDVCIVSRADVQWNRPIFKAPPIQLNPKVVDSARVAEELRRISLIGR
jgi:hypothetical protein